VRVAPGEAAEVSTGSMMPPGAQAMVIIEYSQAEGDRVYGQARLRQLRPELCPWPRYGGPGAGRSP
jgi:molybdopterin biosynthesis enzyme